MILTYVDVETAYSTEYSLTRIPTANYVLHPNFELICAAIAEGDGPSTCYWGDDAVAKLTSLDWSNRCLISHNVRFDGSVLGWRLGIYPALYACTMAMAEIMVAPYAGGASLAKVCEWLRTPPKTDEVIRARGKWRKDFTLEEAQRYMVYCLNDNDRCRDVFRLLAPNFPKNEYLILDHMTRMFTQPQLQLDATGLYTYASEIEQDKADLLERIGLTDRADLMSQDKFADMLRALEIDPPMKVSPQTQQLTYAFAKTDEEFSDLLDHEDEDVAALVAARLGHKTTIEQTRTNRFIEAASLTADHWAPVPMRYGAAITHRPGGTDKQNWTNLRRTHPKRPDETSPLRKSIVAPAGHKIVAVDASQIELRLLMWQARQMEMLQLFEEKRSAYIEFGEDLFGRRITKAEKEPYTLAKICVLSCGYAVGALKFKRAARAQSGGLLRLSVEDADDAVRTYRRVNYQVPKLWRVHDQWIPLMASGVYVENIVIDGHVVWQIQPQALKGPSGLFMPYPALRRSAEDPEQFVYDFKRKTNVRLFGPKVTENTCQHLTRCIVAAAEIRIKQRTGLRPALSVYDELVYVVPDDHVEYLKPILVEEMSRRPEWAPGLPLAAEAKHGQSYGDCE